MKVRLRYFTPAFLYIWLLFTMYSCLPGSHSRTSQSIPFMQGIHYSNNDLYEFTTFSNKPEEIPLARKRLHEISGIAASLQYKGLLYLHEDNGHSNYLYLTNA